MKTAKITEKITAKKIPETILDLKTMRSGRNTAPCQFRKPGNISDSTIDDGVSYIRPMAYKKGEL